jgi:hypothetical protein
VINECDGDYSNSLWEESYSPPLFENLTLERDVTVTIGKTALLICRVKNLGDRAVSLSSQEQFRHFNDTLYKLSSLWLFKIPKGIIHKET